ncbi:hypothetical protein [Marinirhabdus gelatinilytica]|uniref:O-antigen ligase n=1 Tax=Marinirhabdus gelatinilytica TaxID=1703343 RepID=A0A370Q4E4_9FLAO|nr:hypothetical protein [Marinirhabdus gelatinilytica]RDK83241.1 O-antigen ligase [Marinirhabdus gelatinilytica]
MSIPKTLLSKNTLENRLLLLIFLFFFGFFILQPPLYSPDTYSYLRADITRFPGYIIYLRGLQAVFGSSFDVVALAGHLVMGYAAIVLIFKNLSNLFKLSWVAKGLLLAALVFPYFKPIEVAVNLTSEGLAYPLYLLLLSLTIDFLFRKQEKKIIHITFVYLALVLTRGQFIILGPIIGFLYALQLKRNIFRPKAFLIILLLFILPIVSAMADRTYHYIFYGYFKTTPYSYVNVVALPLYISEASDAKYFPDEDIKVIFEHSHKKLDSLQLLSSDVKGSYHEKYMRFHYNFPEICNQNIHDFGLKYYLEQGEAPGDNAFAIEAACKTITTQLVPAHFKEYLSLYYTSIIHGFKSVFILFFMVALSILSLFKVFKRFGRNSGLIFLATLLIISNAMIVAVASHSIMRYLFYNYFLGLLILIILLKKFIPRHES